MAAGLARHAHRLVAGRTDGEPPLRGIEYPTALLRNYLVQAVEGPNSAARVPSVELERELGEFGCRGGEGGFLG